MAKKLLTLLEMFVFGNVVCGSNENKPRMATRITRGKWLPHNARYFMRRGVSVVRNFVDSRLHNHVSRFEFF